MDKLFAQWSEKRNGIITKENYSTEEDFKKVISNFQDFDYDNIVNPTLKTADIISRMEKGEPMVHYARASHKNTLELEKRLTALETGNLANPEHFSAAVFGSGMGAITTVLRALGNKNGRFIKGNAMYFHTNTALEDTGRGDGLNHVGSLPARTVNLTEPENLINSLKFYDNILGVILEPVANPTLAYTDIRDISDIAHEHDIPVIVDNTFTSPYLIEPFRMGADIVVYSLTKYYSGGGDLTGGTVIMPNEFAGAINHERTVSGPILSMRDAVLYADRVKNIANVMEAHCKNTEALAEALKDVKGINVTYQNLGNKTRNGYAGGVLSFIFKGNDENALTKSLGMSVYLDTHKGPRQAVSLGDPETLIFPEGAQLGKDLMKKTGTPMGLVRIAVGREKEFQPVINYIKEGIRQTLL